VIVICGQKSHIGREIFFKVIQANFPDNLSFGVKRNSFAVGIFYE